MNAPSTGPSLPGSPAAAQINEALKNVAAMNNKVGGRRKTRKVKHRKQTRKNLKARKGTRRRGGARKEDYSNCDHIYDEQHIFPSLLIAIEKPKRTKQPGPRKPYRFYDCEEIDDNGKKGYAGRSCESKVYNGMFIPEESVRERGVAYDEDDLVNWCCPRDSDYEDCQHLEKESHTFPSTLIELKEQFGERLRFYDCREETYKGKKGFKGKSCDNRSLNGKFIPFDQVATIDKANNIQELINWCCPDDDEDEEN